MTPRFALLRSLLLLACLYSIALRAAEWSRFRGPNGAGMTEASNLPATFDGSNTVWKVDAGRGWSSPVVWKEKVFYTAESGPGKRGIVCVNLIDGKTLWNYEVSFTEHTQHKFNSFATATPFVDQDRVYVNWTSGNTVEALALDHEGKLLWRKTDLANYIHEHGSGASAVVEDGIMIVRAEFDTGKGGQSFATPEQMDWKSCILGLDAATGDRKWKLDIPNTLNPFSTPIVRNLPGGAHEFILANTTSGYLGIDTKSGKINWQYNPGYKQRSVCSFVLKDDVLFSAFGSGDGGKESGLIKLGGPGSTPEVVGSITKNIPYVPTPLLIGDHLYMLRDGGFLTCLKYPSGETIYSERLSSSSGRSTKYFSSPVPADGKIYCCSQTGDVVVVKAGYKFEVAAANALDAPINATPAITANQIVIRTEKSLWCIGGKPQPVP